MDLIETFIEETNRAETTEQVFSIFERTVRKLGFDRICYSLITDHPSFGLKAGHGVFRNYPEDWMKHYAANNYEVKDPVPKHAFSTSRPFTWDWLIESRELSNDEQRVMNEAREAKLLNGVGIPLYGMNGEIAGIGLANQDGGLDVDKNMLCKLNMLAIQFHLAYTEKETTEESKRMKNVRLTPREREILLWSAEGKGSDIIAELLGISYPTVRFHMNNIFKKLNAHERAFAVAKAIRYGLILPSFVSDGPEPIKLVR